MTQAPPYCTEAELAEVLRKLRADGGLTENLLAICKLLLDAKRADMTGSFALHFTDGRLRRIRTEIWSSVDKTSPDS